MVEEEQSLASSSQAVSNESLDHLAGFFKDKQVQNGHSPRQCLPTWCENEWKVRTGQPVDTEKSLPEKISPFD
ncbi:hypothetical protein OS493_025703 [Desmophyllum pertusum]|uniref:Uncharacterized protein n=1 Tax=Desmophyllum pertusum TaxID=174260 RepID=A0A9X0D248_9CNID|nr:hypothetical protein OS493_025703 [Desmophyllum pertusum]